ncbi:MAG: J domain-containing protein [Chloroflexi bacterium]|nr:J domain-containing protein [Chloroflexota bacterium]
MATDLEAQIAALRADIAAREARSARLRAEINEMTQERQAFLNAYDRVVGPIDKKVAALREVIDDLREQRRRQSIGDPDVYQPEWTPPDGYVPVEEQYRRLWGSPGVYAAADTFTGYSTGDPLADAAEPEDPGVLLKRLWRALARRFHPDLARDDAERDRRTEVMIRINQAYEAGDLATLQALSENDYADSDTPLAVLTLRGLRAQVEALEAEHDQLEAERDALFYDDMMQMQIEAKLLRVRGRDLLRELAQQRNAEFYELLRELDALRAS